MTLQCIVGRGHHVTRQRFFCISESNTELREMEIQTWKMGRTLLRQACSKGCLSQVKLVKGIHSCMANASSLLNSTCETT